MAYRGLKAPDPRLVDGRHRVALPKDVREALDLAPGDYVTFSTEDGEVRIHKLIITVDTPRRREHRP